MTDAPGTRTLVDLYGYQKRWLEDRSRFKIGMWSRQCGKSFSTALEVVLDCLERKTLWVLLSRGERQSKELMRKVGDFCRAMGVVVDELEGRFRIDKTDVALLEAHLPNGSRVVGLPANPDTARGFSGNVVLDEMAFHHDSRAIWTALFPTITRGYAIRVISTPNGKLNKFYDLWAHGGAQWSRHKVDIHTAVADGLPVDVEQLRAGISDPIAWQQEYECDFVDAATALLTYELIDGCEDPLASLDGAGIGQGDLVLGVDIGRKRDLTVLWTLERVGDVLWTREVLAMERAPFRAQQEAMWARLAQPKLRRCCIDATGMGMPLAEEAVRLYGSKVEAVTFSAAAKEDLAIRLLRQFQDKRVRIPVDRLVREDLHSVQRLTTAAGNVRYDASREETGTHADHFWALALAVHATEAAVGPVEYTTVQRRRFSQAGAY